MCMLVLDLQTLGLFCIFGNPSLFCNLSLLDNMNIKILNAGAWSRSSERVPCSLPVELEDFIPEVEDFYRNKHSGRKLQWHHLMSNGIVSHMTQSQYSEMQTSTISSMTYDLRFYLNKGLL